MKEINFGDPAVFNACISEYENLRKNTLHRFASLFKTINSSGNNLINTKNARRCFTGKDLENVSYGIRIIEAKDSADLYGVGNGAELLYDGVNVGYKDSLIRFSTNTFEGIRDATYCDYCRASQNIFGCVGLRKKQYHILNKEYSKEEYESLVKRITQHMEEMPYVDSLGRIYKFGEFFPLEFSPFAYNESVAQEYYPMSEQEATEQGYLWRKPRIRDYQITKNPDDLPHDIKEVSNSVTKETIGCIHGGLCDEQCTTAFKILEPELQFYRRMNLSLPSLCPNCRHYRRIKYRNPLNVRLWHRKCMCSGATSFQQPATSYRYTNTTTHFHGNEPCPNEFETSYAPDRPEIVYCEACYNSEVV